MGKWIYLGMLLFLIIPINLLGYNDQSTSVFETREETKWTIQGESLYLQPSAHFGEDFHYTPGYDWGYDLKGQYNFSKDNSISLLWSRWKMKDNPTIRNTQYTYDNQPSDLEIAYFNRFDVFNLDLNRVLRFRNGLDIIFHGGLQYFELLLRQHAHYSLLTSGNAADISWVYNYKGIGPRVGIGFDYTLLNHIILYIDTAYASLVFRTGSITGAFSTTDIRRIPPQPLGLNFTEDQNGPIGAEEALIGLRYITQLSEGKLNLQFGWTGTAFDEHALKWAGFFLGAQWVGSL